MGNMAEYKSRTSPWRWIPTLYIAEGLPYFAVNTLTVLMYTNLRLSKSEMAFYTGWLYLPWVIRPFWSPFVDLFGTKRLWVFWMQLLMGVFMALISVSLGTPVWLPCSLAFFWIVAFASATHDISADGYYMLELNPKDQAAYVGVRSTFYRVASVAGQGGLVILAGYLENRTGDIPLAWSLTFAILSVFFILIAFYHRHSMPAPPSDHPTPGVTASGILGDFLRTFSTFFRKPHIVVALAFMLLYRLPEALCIKLVQPFFKDSLESGGLALTTSQIGFVNGTVGVVALLAGGVLGGVVIARGGLRRWLWPMAASLALPCVVYCYLAAVQPSDFLLISSLVAIEQFGYGFGFTAFMMYLIYFSRGNNSTSHYAFCTAFMALGMMLPGMAAGWIYECFEELDSGSLLKVIIMHFMPADRPTGYLGFFIFVMITTLATFAVTHMAWLKTDPAEDNTPASR